MGNFLSPSVACNSRSATRSIRRILPWNKTNMAGTVRECPKGMESARNTSGGVGSGVGKGGGDGGSVRASGGSLGKRSAVQEEDFFRKEQEQDIQALRRQFKDMADKKIEYHQKQLNRHLSQITKKEAMMAKSDDPHYKIQLESHRESAEAHRQYIEQLNKSRNERPLKDI